MTRPSASKKRSPIINRQIRLAGHPEGLPSPENWSLSQSRVPDLCDGEFLVRNLYLSLDPAMRGWISGRASYAAIEIGEVMRAPAVGQVIASRHDRFAVGDHVAGVLRVEEYSVSDGDGMLRVDPDIAPLPVFLGTLGFTGFTAYFGVLEIARPEPGQTFVVSGAAGATGMVAGQMARMRGCRVIGIAGGPAKCSYLVDELGFDAAIDYRAEKVVKRLRELCPEGVDVFFDNVGGDVLEAVLANLARNARVVICGAVSQYNNGGRARGPGNYLALIPTHATMQGFLVGNYRDRWPEALDALAGWLSEGRIITREHIDEGIENFPASLLKLYTGENIGKLVLKLSTTVDNNADIH